MRSVKPRLGRQLHFLYWNLVNLVVSITRTTSQWRALSPVAAISFDKSVKVHCAAVTTSFRLEAVTSFRFNPLLRRLFSVFNIIVFILFVDFSLLFLFSPSSSCPYFLSISTLFFPSTSISCSLSPRSRDSSVGIATAYGPDDQGVRVRVPVGAIIFPSQCRPDWLWGPPGLLSNGSFPAGKAAGARSWPLTSS
jgi:hypothetical protein